MSTIRRLLRDLFQPWPEKTPNNFQKAAARLLFLRHIAEYEWAIPYVKGADVLDLGSNWGHGLRILAPHAKSIVGAELCFEVAAESRRLTGARVVQANGQKLPFPDDSFDAVVSVHVIEHAWDDVEFVREVFRVLKPGGTFVVSTPHQPVSSFINQNPEFDEHLREYMPSELKSVLGTAFGGVEVHGVFCDELSDAIERRRAWRKAEAYYLPGWKWAMHRGVLRFIRKSFIRGRKLTQAEIDSIIGEKGDAELLKHFFLGQDDMYRAHHLFGVCKKYPPADFAVTKPGDANVASLRRRNRQRIAEKRSAVALDEPWPEMSDDQIVERLRSIDAENVVLSDGPFEQRPVPGYRVRSSNHWRQLLAAAGLEFEEFYPVEGLVNASKGKTSLWRRMMDPFTLWLAPWFANRGMILARRSRTAGKLGQRVEGATQFARTHNTHAMEMMGVTKDES